MRPILFTWREKQVYSYPALLFLGLVFGFAAGNVAANVLGLDTAHTYAAMYVLLVPAIIGSRLLFVALHWPVYRNNRRRIFRPGEGGLAMYGGALAVFPASILVLGALNVSLPAFWDAASFVFLVGLIFGRMGCLLNGCCSGRPAERWFALRLPDHCGAWQRRIPTQLMDAGWAVVLLVGATHLLLAPHTLVPGAIFLFTVGGYGTGRLVLQTMRIETDAPSPARRLHRTAQVLLALVPLALLLLVIR